MYKNIYQWIAGTVLLSTSGSWEHDLVELKAAGKREQSIKLA